MRFLNRWLGRRQNRSTETSQEREARERAEREKAIDPRQMHAMSPSRTGDASSSSDSQAEVTASNLFTAEQRNRLKERTQKLIQQIIKDDPKVIVFLDRSARPVSWMVQAAWKRYGEGKSLPTFKFMKFGREKGEILGYKGEEPQRTDFKWEEDWRKAVQVFWQKIEGKDEFLQDMRQSLTRTVHEPSKSILIVDDFSAGFTLGLAWDFFHSNLPDIECSTWSFLRPEDEKLFSKPGWPGAYLPWSEDKSYTLLADNHSPASLRAAEETDPSKVRKGLALQAEISAMFSEE